MATAKAWLPALRVGAASVMGNQRLCGGGELGLCRAFIEQRPGRAAFVAGVQDDIGSLIVERLDERAGEVEYHRAVAALAHLSNQAPQRRGLNPIREPEPPPRADPKNRMSDRRISEANG